jgi:hypothetical protein
MTNKDAAERVRDKMNCLAFWTGREPRLHRQRREFLDAVFARRIARVHHAITGGGEAGFERVHCGGGAREAVEQDHAVGAQRLAGQQQAAGP